MNRNAHSKNKAKHPHETANADWPPAYYGPPPGIQINVGDQFTLSDGTRVRIGRISEETDVVARGWVISDASGKQMDVFPASKAEMLDLLLEPADPLAVMFGLAQEDETNEYRLKSSVAPEVWEEGRGYNFLVIADDNQAVQCLTFEPRGLDSAGQQTPEALYEDRVDTTDGTERPVL